MESLFERRELTKKVNVHAKFLQNNIQSSLLGQLKIKFQGRCLAEGYLQRDSITIVKYAIGRCNYLRGGVDYDVTFQADICMPHVGQIFKAPVTLRNKIGIHAELEPMRILIPRDLHVGNGAFDKVDVGDQLEFEVVGTQFKQGDEDIIVIGKLMKTEEAEPEVLGNPEKPAEVSGITVVGSTGSDEKQVVVMPTAPSDKPKRRRLKHDARPTE
jgi:DNA-directed RNA polymerase subunit E'/Rpb7